MSHPRDIRLECLRLAKPDVSMPDVKVWIARSQELEAWINAVGQPETAPHEAKPALPPSPGQGHRPQARK